MGNTATSADGSVPRRDGGKGWESFGRAKGRAGAGLLESHCYGVLSVGVPARNCKAVTGKHSGWTTSLGVPKSRKE